MLLACMGKPIAGKRLLQSIKQLNSRSYCCGGICKQDHGYGWGEDGWLVNEELPAWQDFAVE